jgi:hypothetical protein
VSAEENAGNAGRGERPRMTMRVYTATRDGIVTARRAVVAVLVGENTSAYELGQAWPPCMCPRHRDQNAPPRRLSMGEAGQRGLSMPGDAAEAAPHGPDYAQAAHPDRTPFWSTVWPSRSP